MGKDTQLHHPKSYENGVDHEYFACLCKNNPVFKQAHKVYPDGYWNATRHEDVTYISRHSQLFSNRPHPFPDPEEGRSMEEADLEFLISLDPPDHTKMRKIINQGFTPRRVSGLEEKIQATSARNSRWTILSASSSTPI